ncbi:DUF882 domain-containing protein [Chelativorans alearense]|uniref:DUF882 domain-containing protein n=1 Tax=Chelativorans alearense TaxID=2681495 RepID=UPI0013D0FD33|nr:DUF882 domain-containing protein [Chelativorans alearense]
MLAVTVLFAAAPAATAETRTLKFYFLHTKERAEITYKRNGRYLQSGLNQVNQILRDWRRNEPTKMDPRLLDLLWEVYRASGSRDYIHVVSAYRSPATNAMLRSRSSGVAEKSQHMLGKAVDFYLPDVKLSTLRNLGLKMQIGGVGYYPRSGSPFVHLDVGNVRHWPRMSRTELASVFPDGKTLHVPSDGKPLPGYQQALASYEARQRNGGSIQVADDSGGRRRGRGLLAALFGGGADEEEDNADTQVAAAPRPAQAVQQAQRQVAQPQQAQPEPETPATILAALPARSVPVPRGAPRPTVEVGTPLQVEASTPENAEEAAPQEEAVQVALNVPRPTRRPDYAPAEETAESEDDATMQVATAFVTPTRRPEPPRSSDAIAEILAAQKDGLPEKDVSERDAPERDAKEVLTAAMPVPAVATGIGRPEYTLAALPTAPRRASGDEGRQAARATGPAAKEQRAAASPRTALLKENGGMSPEALLSGNVKTTPKGPKPAPADTLAEPKAMVLPVTVATAQRMLSRESVLDRTQHADVPAFSAEIAAAPKAVYTGGFEQGVEVADARSFSGRAVTFLSVAKFE